MSDLLRRAHDVVSNPVTTAESTTGSRRSSTPVLAEIRKRATLGLGFAALVSLAACGVQPPQGPYDQGGYGQAGPVLNGNELVGGAIGAAGGGLLGSQFGRGSGKTAATVGGVLLGAILGSRVGGAVGYPNTVAGQQGFYQGGTQQPWYPGQRDYRGNGQFGQGQNYGLSRDQVALRQGLLGARVGTTLVYVDPQTGFRETYQIVREGMDGNGDFCRQFQANVIAQGQPTSGYGTICRGRDGSIRLSAADDTAVNRFAEITGAAPGYEDATPAGAASRMA